MPDQRETSGTELPAVRVRTYAVRRAEDDLDTFTDAIVALLNAEKSVIDLSRYHNATGTIELRLITPEPRSEL